MLLTAIHTTPVGHLYLVARDQILLAAGFRSFKDLFSRMDAIDSKDDKKEVKKIPVISDLVSDYFDGDITALNGIKVQQPGAKFSQDVWKAMRKWLKQSTVVKVEKRIGRKKSSIQCEFYFNCKT